MVMAGHSAPRPLLRSPPFPWVKPGVAAISRSATAENPVDDRGGREQVLSAILRHRIGGDYWLSPLPPENRPAVVIAATSASRAATIAAAISTPGAALLHDTPQPAGGGRIRRLDPVDPWSLLTGDVRIHADPDHELAALAIVAGAPLVLHGTGRFMDAAAVYRHVAGDTVYRDPFIDAPIDVDGAIAILADWRQMIDANRPVRVAAGIAGWKRAAVRRFLWAPRRHRLRFLPGGSAAIALARRRRGTIIAWPSRVPADFPARAASAGVATATIEDGFLRSTGLGSALHVPWSLAIDHRGLHYDPAQPSDLEYICAYAGFSDDLLGRARRLRDTIVERGIGKYGVGTAGVLPIRQPGRRLVLIAGQVSDDLSVLRGGGGYRDPRDLLAAVRSLEPDSEIWYRPHPDVDAGFRAGGIADTEALRHVDHVVRGGSMAQLLDIADDIHVLTSLTGFEALLRGKAVTVHGVPFFAGWGLTRDIAPIPARRGRILTLDQLVAAALILYPRYIDPATTLPCSAETMVARLSEQRGPQRGLLTTLRSLQGAIARLFRQVR